MRKLVYYFLFGAILFAAIQLIQKDMTLPQEKRVIEYETITQDQDIVESFSNFSSNNLHQSPDNYLDFNKECIQDNTFSLISQSVRTQSTPSKSFKVSISYKTIKAMSSFLCVNEQRECVNSIISNNFSKYTSGYYLYSLSRIVI